MGQVWAEILFILLLLAANGVLAMTEIAVVSARKSRLRQLAQAGNAGAQAALNLAESPNRFLSTVQIGITLVGILAGAFGGATIADELAAWLGQLPILAPHRQTIALAVVVLCITYFSLVLGELVPKRLGLNNPEGVAAIAARPMNILSRVASPLVTFLSFSTDTILKLLRIKPRQAAGVTEDEIKSLMLEGVRGGAFNRVETQIVNHALDLDQLTVEDLMTPRTKIIWLNVEDSHQAIWHKIVVSRHTRFPVYEKTRDKVVGIVSVKAIYAHLAAGIPVKLRDIMVRPLIVPATQSAVLLLETFKQSAQHTALVTDEFGAITGLVALHDVMEALVGDFPSRDERMQPGIRRHADETWLADGLVEIDKVQAALPGFSLSASERGNFRTLAGFIVKGFGRVPREGETLEAQGYVFEVLDMDGHRVDKVLVLPRKRSE